MIPNEYNPLKNPPACELGICTQEPRDLRTAVRKEDEVLHQLQDILGEIYSVLTGEPPQKDGIKVVHCKDCAYMEPGVKDSNEVWCCWHDSGMMEDDFCSKGKEKEHE